MTYLNLGGVRHPGYSGCRKGEIEDSIQYSRCAIEKLKREYII